jgi:hypothetical protein
MTDVKVSVPPTQQNNCAHFKSCAFVGTRCRYTAYSDYTADWQPKNRFLFPAGQEICPFTKTSRPGFETHVASYSVSAGGSFLGVKATSVWSRPLHLVPRLGIIGALPHMLSYKKKVTTSLLTGRICKAIHFGIFRCTFVYWRDFSVCPGITTISEKQHTKGRLNTK